MVSSSEWKISLLNSTSQHNLFTNEMKREFDHYRLMGPFWTFPILASVGEMVVVRLSEIALLKIQREAIATMLDRIGNRKNDEWWMMLPAFEAVTEKFTVGEDPEACVVWNPNESNDKFEKLPFNRVDAFARSWAQESGLVTPEVAVVIWNSMCRYAMHCLINLQRPVSLGFCNLVPFLYRHNWCDIVFTMEGKKREKRLGRKFQGFDVHPIENEAEQEIINRGCLEMMLDESLVGLDAGNFPGWMISVEYLNPWFAQSQATECAKLRKYARGDNRVGYWRAVIDTIKRDLPNALKIYSQYLSMARATIPLLPKKSISRSKNLVVGPWSSYGDSRRVSCRFLDYHRYDGLAGSHEVIGSEDASLPAGMSDIRSDK